MIYGCVLKSHKLADRKKGAPEEEIIKGSGCISQLGKWNLRTGVSGAKWVHKAVMRWQVGGSQI